MEFFQQVDPVRRSKGNGDNHTPGTPLPFPKITPFLEDLLAGAWDVFAVLDEDGTARCVSPANRRLLGYAPEDLVGKNGFSYVHPDDRGRVDEAFQQLYRAPATPVTFTHRFRTADGYYRRMETTVENMLDHPAIQGFVVHSHDISKRDELHGELQIARQNLRRLQLHPHFLFNVLSTIQTQLATDPEAAAETVGHLGDLLRLSYAHVDSDMVPLGDEIDFIARYVDLFRTRFPDRIAATFDVPDNLRSVSVPALLLQPLVENALQHGLLPAEGGQLTVRARASDETLFLTVIDDGIGLTDESTDDDGIGLSTTQARLRQTYDRDATLDIRPGPDGGTMVTVTLPLDKDDP